jgi:hypothetical protein
MLEHCVRKFEEAGIDVQEVGRWGKPRLRVRVGVKGDLALAVLSLMAYVDRDRCFAEREEGPNLYWDETTYVVWHPTRWVHRFASDVERRFWAFFMSMAAVFVVVVGAYAAGAARLSGEVGLLQVAASAAVLVAVLAVLRWRWGDEPGLGLDALWLRLALGVVVGTVWALAIALPSAEQVLGAFWIFAASNVLWVMSIGYDRWRFEKFLDHLGGRLSWRQAHEVLDRVIQPGAL